MDVWIVTSIYRSADHLAGCLEQLEACMRSVEDRGLSAESIVIRNAPDRRERRILASLTGPAWWREHGRLTVVPRETLYASWKRGIRLAPRDPNAE